MLSENTIRITALAEEVQQLKIRLSKLDNIRYEHNAALVRSEQILLRDYIKEKEEEIEALKNLNRSK